MEESLENALRGIDGKNLVTDEISNVLESIKEDEIPDCWADVAYPTLDNLPDFISDLVYSRVKMGLSKHLPNLATILH